MLRGGLGATDAGFNFIACDPHMGSVLSDIPAVSVGSARFAQFEQVSQLPDHVTASMVSLATKPKNVE